MVTGDIAIRGDGPTPATLYVVSAVPGPGQFGCATRDAAERLALAYAAHAHVDVWFAEGRQGPFLVGRFRRAPRLQIAPARPARVRAINPAPSRAM